MDPHDHARRSFGTAALAATTAALVAAGLQPATALAQPAPPAAPWPANPLDYGREHQALVEQYLGLLSGSPSHSADGLRKLIGAVDQQKLLNPGEATALQKAVDVIARGLAELQSARQALNNILSDYREKGSALLKAILAIVMSSVDFCAEHAARTSPEQRASIVMKDMSGALTGGLTGALAGAGMAITSAGISVPLFAAMGALIGAASSSLAEVAEVFKAVPSGPVKKP